MTNLVLHWTVDDEYNYTRNSGTGTTEEADTRRARGRWHWAKSFGVAPALHRCTVKARRRVEYDDRLGDGPEISGGSENDLR